MRIPIEILFFFADKRLFVKRINSETVSYLKLFGATSQITLAFIYKWRRYITTSLDFYVGKITCTDGTVKYKFEPSNDGLLDWMYEMVSHERDYLRDRHIRSFNK